MVDELVEAVATKEKKIPVVEIFGPTIEGEGALIGFQTMFIRFGLCDFKCTMCDSMHAVDPKIVKTTAQWIPVDEIARQVLEVMPAHIKHITFSGGNPAIHELGKLVVLLQDAGKTVFVETQGTKKPDWLYMVDHLVVSPKGPGMGEIFKEDVFMEFMHTYLSQGVSMSVKIPVFHALDLEFAAAVGELCLQLERTYPRTFKRSRDFFLSLGNPYPPVYTAAGAVDVDKDTIKSALVNTLLTRYNTLSVELMQDPRLNYARFLPQLHTLVWGNEKGK